MGSASGKHLQRRHGQAREPTSWLASGRGQASWSPTATETTYSEDRYRGPGGEEQTEQQQEAEELRQRGRGGGAVQVAKPEILKILYTNIQSVFSKINELIVNAVDQCPDIILLTETWCNTSISYAALAIPGYQLE